MLSKNGLKCMVLALVVSSLMLSCDGKKSENKKEAMPETSAAEENFSHPEMVEDTTKMDTADTRPVKSSN